MAMTAYSPIYRGMLSDIDTRWTVISQSVDDRTPSEREGVSLSINYCHLLSLIVRNIYYSDNYAYSGCWIKLTCSSPMQ